MTTTTATDRDQDVESALVHIHRTAETLSDGGTTELDVVAFLAGRLQPNEVEIAKAIHAVLHEWTKRALHNCGRFEPADLELLDLLIEYAELYGWTFEHGGWKPCGDPPEPSA